MPYESLAQERWAHTPAGTKALGGKDKVAEWDSATKGKKLPQRVEFGLAAQGRAKTKATKRK